MPGGRADGSAYVGPDGALPTATFEVADDDATVGTLQRIVLPGFGLVGPVLDGFLAAPHDWTPDTVVPAFVELEPQPAGWVPPAGWSEVPVAKVRFDGPDELRGRFGQWVAERSGAAPDPLAPPWSRTGWHAAATAWIDDALAGVGRTRTGTVEQVRAWGISTVLRTRSNDGRTYWFKAVCEHFRSEVPITAALHATAPGAVPPVIAAAAAGWLLLGDVGGDASAPARTGEPASHATAFAALRSLQRAVEARAGELSRAGVVSRPLATLPDRLADALGDAALRHWHGATPARCTELVEWTAEQVDRVGALGLPDVLVHGDFHPGNVAEVAGGRRVLFDWSDAAFAPPFVDVVTWLSWIDDEDAGTREAVWRSFAEQWADVLEPEEWLAHRRVLEGVAGAYHTVSYVGILRNLDSLRRHEHGDGIRQFFTMLDRAV